jgi:hypothetical protein
MVKVSPSQIDPLFTEITGREITLTTETAAAVEVQPALLVPETE